MVEKQVYVKILIADLKQNLAADKGKSSTQFQ